MWTNRTFEPETGSVTETIRCRQNTKQKVIPVQFKTKTSGCGIYYDYAHEKAKRVADLRQELFGEIVQIVAEDPPESEEDEEDNESPLGEEDMETWKNYFHPGY